MKKTIAMLLALLLMLSLAACGAEEEPNADLVITRAPEEATEATETTPEETEAPEEKAQGPFAFEYEGVKLLPGMAFDASVLPKADAVYTVPSCALEGTDNVYNYTAFEITAFDDGYGEDVYSIYLMDPNVATPEGLAQGDDEAKIVELYGEDYVQEGTSYVYTRESTILSIIVQDGVVISIEYRLDI